jgi:hypothetical protein
VLPYFTVLRFASRIICVGLHNNLFLQNLVSRLLGILIVVKSYIRSVCE